MTDAPSKTYRFPASTPITVVLRKLRDERGWSQSDLARNMTHRMTDWRTGEIEIVPYDHSYISRIESGKRTPSREFIDAAVVAFNLNPFDPDFESLYLSAGFVPYGHTLDVNLTVYKLSARMAEIEPEERVAIEKTLALLLKGIS